MKSENFRINTKANQPIKERDMQGKKKKREIGNKKKLDLIEIKWVRYSIKIYVPPSSSSLHLQ